MIRHPMQKCPAEFVPVFREILENSYWDALEPAYICHHLGRLYSYGRITSAQTIAITEWIAKCLQGSYSLGGWLWGDIYPEHANLMQGNQCRKAWLEWLISPEGHY